jgi:hypothetical protein
MRNTVRYMPYQQALSHENVKHSILSKYSQVTNQQ